MGDEPAAARAPADLAYQLLDVTAADTEEVTHRPVRLPG
ncbi:dsRBD fold-containing protein [Actinoplanes rectilineatus]